MAWLTPGAVAASRVPIGQMQTVAEPFVWGAGGERMTPEEIAYAQQLADQQMAMGSDYSPVGSIWQGLARVSQGVMGGLQAREAREASEANAAESDALMRAMMTEGGSTNEALLRAMTNPYASEQAQGLAAMMFERNNPKAPAPTEFERVLQGAGIVPGSPEWVEAMQAKARNTIDPEIIAPLPGGQGTYVGPRSGLSSIMGGGDPISSGQGGGDAPETLPPDFDFGGPTRAASGSFR